MFDYEGELKLKGYSLIAGVDEAGRGPLAGPVVSAAVILKCADFKSRIDDSKKLSSLQREKAYTEIKEKAYVAVGIVGEKVIDQINILQATLLSMKKAVAFLEPSPEFVLVDGNTSLSLEISNQSIIGGDAKCLSIACASIIAKVARDRIMAVYDRYFPEYGFLQHKGYGTKRHLEVLRKIGPCLIHRRSFQLKSKIKIKIRNI